MSATGQGSSSLFGAANDDTTRSLIGDHAFENFEKGILADLFPSTTGTGNVMPEIVTTLNNNSGSVVQNTTIISSQGQAIMTTPLALSTSASGNQILAQLQPQQIQVQVKWSLKHSLIIGSKDPSIFKRPNCAI